MSKQPPSHLPFISPSLPWCLMHDTSRRISHQSERFWWHRLLGFVRWEFLCGSDSFFFNTVILRACGGEKKKKKFTFLLHYTSQRRLVMTAHMTPMLCCGKCLSAIHCVSADRTCHRVFRCAESFLTLAPSLLSHRHIHAVETFCACSLNSVQFVRE